MNVRNLLLQWMAVLLLGGVNSALAANLVQNPGFESEISNLNWTLVGNARVATCGNGSNTITPATGSWFDCSNTNSGTVTQIIPTGNVPAAGTQLSFSFKYARATPQVPTISWSISGGGLSTSVTGSVTNATQTWQQATTQTVTIVSQSAITITFTIAGANNARAGLDDIVLDALPVQLCRILRLKSSGAVPLANQTTPTRFLFGTGAFNATCTGTSCSVQIKTNEGMFTSNGLIYNDGQFPVSAGCAGAWEQCFPTQSASPPFTATLTSTSPPNDFNLSGLVLTGGGGTITFTNGTNYSYSGGKFAVHSGTYGTTDCTTTVPEPGTLVLMLLPLAGLGLARRRQAKQRSGPRAARIH